MIYCSSGWPSEFDRESCASKLHEFVQRGESRKLAKLAVETN